MSLPRYPEYKGSGVEWLGEIPSHWSTKPLWTLFRRSKRVGHEAEQLLSVYRDHGVVPKNSRSDNNNKPSDDLSPYQLVCPGDLAINKMKAWQGSVAISHHRGIVSPAYFIYESQHEEDSRYLHYLMRSPRYITGYLSVSKGIRVNQWDLEPQHHSRLPVMLPPKAEQEAIADFIDTETTKIDALIAEQETLLALLAEKRQATISHAVTRGLDPNVPVKDSGVAWLGKVPAHWQPQKIGHAFDSIGSGTTPPSDESHWYIDGTIPWVTTGELREDVVITTSKYVTQEAIATFGALKIHPAGALVIAMYGATIGRLGVLGVPATTNQACCVLSGPRTLDVRFTFYWLHCQKQKIVDLYATGGGQPNINRETVSSLRVPAPGLVEQAQIAAYLDTACARLRQLQTLSERSISSLKERRSALISAAVTGQIDVRGLVDRDAA